MDVNCDQCGKEIPMGEKFFCYSVSFESFVGQDSKIEWIEVVNIYCKACEFKRDLKKNAEAQMIQNMN